MLVCAIPIPVPVGIEVNMSCSCGSGDNIQCSNARKTTMSGFYEGNNEGSTFTSGNEGNDTESKQMIEDKEEVEDDTVDVNLEPQLHKMLQIGNITSREIRELQFSCVDDAYIFYNEYVKVKGFGIRRGKVGHNCNKE
ncbi:hypothetical protein RJT34_12811 [Clitoria ternatea]|uniref:FAR1 domain-containing protein n=1 Tax=Clitoria ternatea TaxID=43366 RepID=A0AAN9JPJ7_CLITE